MRMEISIKLYRVINIITSLLTYILKTKSPKMISSEASAEGITFPFIDKILHTCLQEC